MSPYYPYTLVLTHDVDAITIAELPIASRTFWGFSYRGLVGNLWRCCSGDISPRQYGTSVFWSVASPLTKIGVGPDPWHESFLTMIEIEKAYKVRSTLFLISIPASPGHAERGGSAPHKRSAHYRLSDWRDYLLGLHAEGWELAVHGLDCHLSALSARRELEAFARVFGLHTPGLRMHWLYASSSLRSNAREAGYSYDSTLGWNEQIGFPEGRLRPFIDPDSGLPIVPLNIQDSALMGEWRQGLSRNEAWSQVEALMDRAATVQAVLTVLWHSTSFGPPRFWQDLYVNILERALSDGARVVRAIDAVRELVQQDDHPPNGSRPY